MSSKLKECGFVSRNRAGLLLVDVQEKLFPFVERAEEIAFAQKKAICGFRLFELPIVVTEQYPKGLGSTIPFLKGVLGEQQTYLTKTSFSCLGDEKIREHLLNTSVDQWVLIGIEAHICVLQTAKELLKAGKEVIVLNDAISSRSLFDFSTAISELRDCGARVSSTETILFEFMRDANLPEFKQFSQIIQQGGEGCCKGAEKSCCHGH